MPPNRPKQPVPRAQAWLDPWPPPQGMSGCHGFRLPVRRMLILRNWSASLQAQRINLLAARWNITPDQGSNGLY